jgi:hypothetical protein
LIGLARSQGPVLVIRLILKPWVGVGSKWFGHLKESGFMSSLRYMKAVSNKVIWRALVPSSWDQHMED